MQPNAKLLNVSVVCSVYMLIWDARQAGSIPVLLITAFACVAVILVSAALWVYNLVKYRKNNKSIAMIGEQTSVSLVFIVLALSLARGSAWSVLIAASLTGALLFLNKFAEDTDDILSDAV